MREKYLWDGLERKMFPQNYYRIVHFSHTNRGKTKKKKRKRKLKLVRSNKVGHFLKFFFQLLFRILCSLSFLLKTHKFLGK